MEERTQLRTGRRFRSLILDLCLLFSWFFLPHTLYGRWKQRLKPQRTKTLKIRIGESMAPVTLLVGQSVPATAVPLEADGVTPTPGAIVSNPSWSVTDPTIASLTANADGTATLKAIAPGTVRVDVVAAVTDSDGTVSTFSGSNTLTVSAPSPPPTGRTASLGVSFGTPN
jgi:hypothetical protein